MSAHADTEDQLVEQPASGWFAELGWTAVSAVVETFSLKKTVGTTKYTKSTKWKVLR